MRFSVMLRSLIGAVGCVALAIGQLQAADKIPADRRLPAATLLSISCPDVPRSIEQFHQTAFGKLFKDPSLDEFKAQLTEKLKEKSEEISNDLGIPVEDLQALAAGEVTFAVVRPSNEPLAGLLFMDIGENQETLNALLQKAEDTIEGATIEKENQSLQGVEVTVCTVIPKRNPNEAKTFAFFIKDETFVVGSSLSVIKGVIQRWKGDQPRSLAEAPIYQAIMDRCRTSPRTPAALTWYADPVGLITAGMAMVPQAQMASVLLSANLPKLGLDKFKAVGGVSEFGTEEFDSVSRTLFYATPPAQGLVKVFEFRPTVSAPPAWVPSDISQFIAADWNVPGAYSAIEGMYDSITGQPGGFAAMAGGALRLPDGTAIDLKGDVIDALSGMVQGYTTTGDEDDEEDLYGVVCVGLADATKGKELVERLMSTQGELKTTEISGATIFESADESKTWAMAVQGKNFFASNDIDMLKEALSGKSEEPLVNSAAYKALAKQVPKSVSLLSYQNPYEQLYDQYEALRDGKYDGLAEEEIDFSTLPPFEKLKGHFQPAMSYIVPDENGALHVSFSLKAK